MTFGPHWKADISGVSPDLITDEELINNFMKRAVELAEMKIIHGPETFYYEHEKPHECGCTSILVLADSHMTLHSFINDGWIFLDLFSCKSFDTEELGKLVMETFKPTLYHFSVENRGRSYDHGDSSD